MAYCRYADDFVLIVKGTKAQAEAIREECRGVLEGSLKLRLNMDKTKITHVDGFIFLGHRIIHKRSRYGEDKGGLNDPAGKPETSPHR